MPGSTSSSEAERTVRLVLEYDGTDLAGWQRQDNALTVQQHLEEALASMLGRHVPVAGASRTDAGVHALGQVASFRAATAIPLHGLRRGLNSALPESIAVVAAAEAGPDFHARFSARGKHYRYRILARPDRAPLERRTAWHRARPLDLAAMRAAAGHLIGEHDFSAFRAAGCSARHAVRRIDAVEVTGGAVIAIDVRGNAFVRNMVRIIAGTLIDVGEGRIAPDRLPAILASREREQAGQTAPAHGLTLVEVFYGE